MKHISIFFNSIVDKVHKMFFAASTALCKVAIMQAGIVSAVGEVFGCPDQWEQRAHDVEGTAVQCINGVYLIDIGMSESILSRSN